MNTTATPDRLLRLPDVLNRTGKGRTAWLEDVREGKAPRPVKIGSRAVAWSERAIDQWIADRLNAATPPAPRSN